MFNLLDSHDVPRLHNNENIRKSDYEMAVIIMFMLPGTVSIYYGDEVELSGKTELIEYCRNPMDWNWQQRKEAVERFHFYQKLISLKRKASALQNGGFRIIHEEGYIFSCARFTDKELVIAIVSMDDESGDILFSLEDFGFDNRTFEKDYLGHPVVSKMTKERVLIHVPAHTGYLLYIKNN